MVVGPAVLPFRQYVLKLHSRCDLACDHCYIYEHADQSWRGRPLALSEGTAARVVDRISEHCVAHALRRITVVLHGGEPLLYGAERTRALLELFRAQLPAGIDLDLRIHTNAVQLDTAYLDLFLEFGVKVGVSLDGDRSANDLHRRFASGRTSHPQVLRGLALLRQPQYRSLYAGILCTIDIRNDPVRVYEALLAEEPPRADLLLPHATWDNPPLRVRATGSDSGEGAGAPEYAAWLEAVYDRWAEDGRPFPIRTFDSIAAVLRGLPSQTEALGLAPADLVVLETDGSLEQADSLKTSFDGAAATGFNVFEHSFDQVAAYPGMAARQGGLETLCATCRACPVVEVCGGGLYAHRYRTGTGFENPSVYCEDLKALIEYVRDEESHAEAAAPHRLSPADFDVLSAGYGDEDLICRLSEPQWSVGRGLVTETCGALPPGSPFADAWQELIRLDATSPAAVGSVLEDPYTRVWAVRLLARGTDASPAPADLERLAEIAASAALLAGDEVGLPLHVVGGVVHLPTLGALALGGPERPASIETRRDGTATITADGREYEICVGGSTSDSALEWLPQRRLDAGSWSVAVEDTDPYRDCYQSPAAPRLYSVDIEVWRLRFAEAVSYLEDALPGYLPGLRAGLRVLMPMAPPSGSGHEVSGTARHAFGAVGLALPADGPTFALLLIHEFQHVKLGAVLDAYDFYDQTDERLYYAPWRPDPRPLEGLYQGTYAHLAVTEYWRVRRHLVTGPQRDSADAHFARWRMHTADAVNVLLESGSLTPLGERFARGMGETVAPWLEEPVGHSAVIAAQRAADNHRAAWEAYARQSSAS